jgi:hypothetical protein
MPLDSRIACDPWPRPEAARASQQRHVSCSIEDNDPRSTFDPRQPSGLDVLASCGERKTIRDVLDRSVERGRPRFGPMLSI